MSTSLVIDTTELVPGGLVIGDTGHGKTGQMIPSTGTHGPGFAYDSVALQASFASHEYRGTLGQLPQGLTLKANEDTSFTATAPAGTYTVPWNLYEDGLLVGTSTFVLVFG